ncbi:PDZ domain-containing protein [Streptomyces lincolnensis]|uniref:PDZ domain-containing protein n=1 Tax=Streptomyces lincolnensis TaxID=1915 RepID=UPI001E63C841|nr:PDZ domain-containing protein [Streptomyces lincolnensis]MCD7437186.1 PDZ domain-containing protein [Streptomyces lincolnensis]
MEQTALRPKPMPGQDPGGGTGPTPVRRPHAARRRGRRLRAVLFALSVGTVLVLSGVGLGTIGATVIGMSRLAELQRQAGQAGQGAPGVPGAQGSPSVPADSGPSGPPAGPASARARATLGLEVVDAEKAGAQVVGVHVPGPGYSAGLVRGDVLLAFGRTRIDSAADLAHAVAEARPGKQIVLTVRHRGGGYQQLAAVPGIVT